MRFTKLVGIVTLAVSTAQPWMGPGAAIARPAGAMPADFKPQADAIMRAAYSADGPGAAAIVMRGGRIVYASSRGRADVKAGRAITPDTVFPLASITKQFTAAVVLQLVDEGKLSLDDPIARFFPDWPQPSARATIRQLLNHTSGIQDYTKIPGWIGANRGRSIATSELIALFRSLPAKSSPGYRWEYNNGGYVVLGAIAEKVTGKAWYDLVTERIARPLGLSTIAYGGSKEAVRLSAHGYTREGGERAEALLPNMSIPGAAGGLLGSVRDLAKWAQALHHGRVVSPASYQEMIRPARLTDGSTQPYGFAMRLRQLGGRAALVHGGAMAGFDTASVYLPAEDLFIAVFANDDSASASANTTLRRLGASALGAPIPAFSRAEVDLASLKPLFGRYGIAKNDEYRFFERGEKLYIASDGQELALIPAGQDRFFPDSDALTWFSFVRSPNGSNVALEVHDPDQAQPERTPRLGAIPVDAQFVVPADILRSYVGVYATEVPVMTIAMGTDDWLTIQAGASPPLPMRPISQTEFMVDRAKSRIVFYPEGGRVDRITLYRGARELHGKRVASQ